MIESSTSILRDWMRAILQITCLVVTCISVSLISEMYSHYIIRNKNNIGFWETCTNTETVSNTTYTLKHKVLPSCRSKQEGDQKSFDKHPLFLQASDVSHQGWMFFCRWSTGKLLPCPSHDTLTQRKVSIYNWTVCKAVTWQGPEGVKEQSFSCFCSENLNFYNGGQHREPEPWINILDDSYTDRNPVKSLCFWIFQTFKPTDKLNRYSLLSSQHSLLKGS